LWERQQKEYSADIQATLLKSLISAFGGEAKIPLFSELTRKPQKTETAEEIKNHIIARLTQEGG